MVNETGKILLLAGGLFLLAKNTPSPTVIDEAARALSQDQASVQNIASSYGDIFAHNLQVQAEVKGTAGDLLDTSGYSLPGPHVGTKADLVYEPYIGNAPATTAVAQLGYGLVSFGAAERSITQSIAETRHDISRELTTFSDRGKTYIPGVTSYGSGTLNTAAKVLAKDYGILADWQARLLELQQVHELFPEAL